MPNAFLLCPDTDTKLRRQHTFQTSVTNDTTRFVINENAAFEDETRPEGHSSVVESFAVAWKTSGVHAIHCSINAVKKVMRHFPTACSCVHAYVMAYAESIRRREQMLTHEDLHSVMS